MRARVVVAVGLSVCLLAFTSVHVATVWSEEAPEVDSDYRTSRDLYKRHECWLDSSKAIPVFRCDHLERYNTSSRVVATAMRTGKRLNPCTNNYMCSWVVTAVVLYLAAIVIHATTLRLYVFFGPVTHPLLSSYDSAANAHSRAMAVAAAAHLLDRNGGARKGAHAAGHGAEGAEDAAYDLYRDGYVDR